MNHKSYTWWIPSFLRLELRNLNGYLSNFFQTVRIPFPLSLKLISSLFKPAVKYPAVSPPPGITRHELSYYYYLFSLLYLYYSRTIIKYKYQDWLWQFSTRRFSNCSEVYWPSYYYTMGLIKVKCVVKDCDWNPGEVEELEKFKLLLDAHTTEVHLRGRPVSQTAVATLPSSHTALIRYFKTKQISNWATILQQIFILITDTSSQCLVWLLLFFLWFNPIVFSFYCYPISCDLTLFHPPPHIKI